MGTTQLGRETLQDEVFDEPLVVDNGEIIISKPQDSIRARRDDSYNQFTASKTEAGRS